MHEYEVARLLLTTGAVSLKPNRPYKLASGIASPIYVDCRVLNSHPDARTIVFGHFQNYIDSYIGRNNIDLVVGSGHSGISLAAYLVEKMRVPMAYIRPSSKDHGKENQVEGVVPSGAKAILITDILSDEEHVPLSVRLLRERGVRIVHVLAIFNMKLNIVDEFLKNEDVRYFTLTDLRMLLNTAVSERLISLAERDEIDAWRRDFRDWGGTRSQRLEQDLAARAGETARILLRIKAVTLSPLKPYRFASGIRSPIYCDNRLLMSHPEEWLYIINTMLKIIVNVIGIENIDIIGGTSTAGIPHAAYISERLKLPMIYIKGAAEEYGKRTKIEGGLESGKRVLVIEDLISTGGSSVRAVETVRDAGGLVGHCLAIFSYEMEAARAAFEKVNCAFHTCSNFSTLMRTAEEEGFVSPVERSLAAEWSRDPAGWGARLPDLAGGAAGAGA
jgi:orotate phosphoribosyltransferase